MRRKGIVALSFFAMVLVSVVAFAQPPGWRPGEPYPPFGKPHLPARGDIQRQGNWKPPPNIGWRGPGYPLPGTKRLPYLRAEPYHSATKPTGRMIEICPAHNCSATVLYSPNPLGKYVDLGDTPVFVVYVTVDPILDYLSVGFQVSADDGNTWMDVTGITAYSVGTYYIPYSNVSASTAGVVQTPGSFAGMQGPIGGRVKVRVVCSAFQQNKGSPWQFSAYVLPGTNNHLR